MCKAVRMIFQLSDLEYEIIDSLADGPSPLVFLIRELTEMQHLCERQAIIQALSTLVDKRLARWALQAPHAPHSNPLCASCALISGQGDPNYWFELTESGQTAWQLWRQARRQG